MRSLHHIEVDRDDGAKSYDVALEYLAAGEVVGLFPEATISRSFELKDFKTGTVRMAATAERTAHPGDLVGHATDLHQGPPARPEARQGDLAHRGIAGTPVGKRPGRRQRADSANR